MGGGNSTPVDPDAYNPADDPVDISEIEDHGFPFENLVLEGGGAKACAYAGAIEVLEKVGILKNIKRVAGTSGGAIAGTLVAIGCNAEEVSKYFMPCWDDFADASQVTWLWNLYNKMGFNPGEQALSKIQSTIADKLGKEYTNITFEELYKMRNVELCIVATNLSSMSIQYFHPKTTPKTPIAEAVRMSISIPLFMAPYTYTDRSRKSTYCDGGVLCNYPIHAFDGWFLSMDAKDSFFRKLHNGRLGWFDGYNSRTLGVVVYQTGEDDKMKNYVYQCEHAGKIKRPNTKLARERAAECDDLQAQFERKTKLIHAIDVIFRNVRKFDTDNSGFLNKKQMIELLNNESEELKEAHRLVYGDDDNKETIMKWLQSDKELSFEEFIEYLSEKRNINLEDLTESVSYKKVDGLVDFVEAIASTWMSSGASRYNRDYDANRTIGVCTDYIRTLDLGMEEMDLAFIKRQAKVATAAFLKHVAAHGVIAEPVTFKADVRFEEE